MPDWIHAAEAVIGQSLRAKQREVMEQLLLNKNVFAVLPTGYGKSACFGAFPAAYAQLHPETQPIALVISPLKSLVECQIQSWGEKDVKSTVLKPRAEMTELEITATEAGDYEILFTSPEVLRQKHSLKILRKLKKRIKLIAIDEAHCLYKWGTTFRPDYLKVVEIRSVLTKAVTLALTATASTALVSDVMNSLGLSDRTKIVSLCPDRPEIFLKMEKVGEMESSLSWYVDLLIARGEASPKAIIYARTIDQVVGIYFYLNRKLGEKAVKDGAFHDVNARYVEMYHGCTDKNSQKRIVTNFRQQNSILRCVVASIAFGLGVDIPNVRFILHWGPARDPLAYWQEIGRCSRDGLPGKAITYLPPRSCDSRFIDHEMLQVIKCASNMQICLRRKVLSYMEVGSSNDHLIPTHCCSICAST